MGGGGWVVPPSPPTRTSASNIQNLQQQQHPDPPPVILNPPNIAAKPIPPPPNPPAEPTAQEPVVNFIPIKVDFGQPASPARSRPTSQEYPPKAGKSPTPVAEKNPSPTPAVDPKISKLDNIMVNVEGLRKKIEEFQGSKKDKEYLYLDDALTKHLCSLDCIETEGREEIKQLRKESINKVQDCINILDKKAGEAS